MYLILECVVLILLVLDGYLDVHIVDENWFKRVPPPPKMLCQICKEYVLIEKVDEHSRYSIKEIFLNCQ